MVSGKAFHGQFGRYVFSSLELSATPDIWLAAWSRDLSVTLERINEHFIATLVHLFDLLQWRENSLVRCLKRLTNYLPSWMWSSFGKVQHFYRSDRPEQTNNRFAFNWCRYVIVHFSVSHVTMAQSVEGHPHILIQYPHTAYNTIRPHIFLCHRRTSAYRSLPTNDIGISFSANEGSTHHPQLREDIRIISSTTGRHRLVYETGKWSDFSPHDVGRNEIMTEARWREQSYDWEQMKSPIPAANQDLLLEGGSLLRRGVFRQGVRHDVHAHWPARQGMWVEHLEDKSD